MELGGRPLVEHVVEAALATGLETVVVAKRSSELPPLAVEVLREPDEPTHPLAGILAALRAPGTGERASALLAVGCDMPFLTPELLGALVASPGAAAIGTPDRLQPLPARIPLAALAQLERACAANAPLRAAIAGLEPHLIDPATLRDYGDPALMLLNVNDADGLAAAERTLSSRPARSAPPQR